MVTQAQDHKKWVERESWPTRVKDILKARDRGKCANCSKDLTMELEAPMHIDHMISISKGGCNDMVNLQLLCEIAAIKQNRMVLLKFIHLFHPILSEKVLSIILVVHQVSPGLVVRLKPIPRLARQIMANRHAIALVWHNRLPL